MRWLYVYLRVYKHATLATRGSELTRVSEVEHSPPPIISDQWSHREQVRYNSQCSLRGFLAIFPGYRVTRNCVCFVSVRTFFEGIKDYPRGNIGLGKESANPEF